ncbi:MAG TPA: hypothetical protein VHT49_13810 [Acidimicrobiales bacterium]|nr:hypothetical protein [Acidimicrobiales bacterium]
MDLRNYVENIHRQVETAAEAGGDDARALADRLFAPLDAAIQLTLQDALAAAAEEITCELAPGSVELRLRGRDLEFVVTPAPGDPSVDDPDTGDDSVARPAPVEDDDGGMARINLRLPENLKGRIEQAAGTEALSVNAWLVRAASSALDRPEPGRRQDRRGAYGAQRYTGWAR